MCLLSLQKPFDAHTARQSAAGYAQPQPQPHSANSMTLLTPSIVLLKHGRSSADGPAGGTGGEGSSIVLCLLLCLRLWEEFVCSRDSVVASSVSDSGFNNVA